MNQNQFEILKTEFSLVQEQMNKYDQIGVSISTWMVSLWVATSGWGVQSGHKTIFLFSITIVLLFWFFGGINKTFRQNYRKRRDEIAKMLREIFKENKIREEFSSPHLPEYSLKGLYRNMFLAHVAVPYLTLVLISLACFLLL